MICRNCPAPIGKRNKSGLCRLCCARDPEICSRRTKRTPEQEEERRALARKLSATPEMVLKRAHAVRRSRLSWCPEQHYELNRQLKVRKFLLPERKRIILELVHTESRREVERHQRAMLEKHARDVAQRYCSE